MDASFDFSKLGVSLDAQTQTGQLVFIRNNADDHHFKHQPILRARLRLFHAPVTLARISGGNGDDGSSLLFAPPSANSYPLLDSPPGSRVVKWVAGATVDAQDNAVVYWEPTVVVNWLGSGRTAEFTWQPTSELIKDLPAEDVFDHLAWLKPLISLLRRNIATKGRVVHERRRRACYEEEWDWGPDVIE
jgi:hypothetical protein